MRMMLRNKVPFYCATYKGKAPIKDEYGNYTGEYEILRSNPIRCYGNISAAKGETDNMIFGTGDFYDKVIVMENNTTPVIDEYSVLWLDSVPKKDAEGNYPPHDYVVKKVARSLNSVSIAVSKVYVNG
jgi:hypothetical protein